MPTFLFVAKKEQKELFIRENEPIIQRLNKEGLDDKSIADYITALFNGINSQTFNTPVDLFIEDFLYKTYAAIAAFSVPVSFVIAQGIYRCGDKQKNSGVHTSENKNCQYHFKSGS